ncbi:ATP-dependent protease ATPase subunit HslU [Marinilactibacillus kalidii]|uniref:ATP-dependent protease ATPase subunit HslU n=1 Tax=Marinilactibacillus kalidii TaxID=2820274 RepID=UPI001ABEA2BC|nr:ATP-dependent protease ATPase subunit HslU [Marinilactibacillus kalidii]
MHSKTDLKPREIVEKLDRYIVGQSDAKKSVAVALRNRYRRLKLDEDMQKEITPKNILMIGATGIGKTEIARRLADIVDAPFIKVEATKFTEVGYIGRDVESMIRDLAEAAVQIVKEEQRKNVRGRAESKAIARVAKALAPGIKQEKKKQEPNPFSSIFQNAGIDPNQFYPDQTEETETVTPEISSKREELKDQIRKGMLDAREIEVKVEEKKQATNPMGAPLEQMGIDLSETLGQLKPSKKVKRNVTVKEAVEIFTEEEADKLINQEDINAEAVHLTENAGIVFIDEIDKITSKGQNNSGQVSREGVQRDILPIVEGSTVKTKIGMVNTDHILFIGSGAFHLSKPSDLIPELQGRFPIRVELNDLTKDDFVKILTEPHNALIKQYQALLDTENIEVIFTMESIERIAEIAYEVNESTDNIGARRLHTILERLLEELLFEAPDMQMGEVKITQKYVDDKIGHIVENKDLSRYIL